MLMLTNDQYPLPIPSILDEFLQLSKVFHNHPSPIQYIERALHILVVGVQRWYSIPCVSLFKTEVVF